MGEPHHTYLRASRLYCTFYDDGRFDLSFVDKVRHPGRPHPLSASGRPRHGHARNDNGIRYGARAALDGQRICKIPIDGCPKLSEPDQLQGRVTSFYGSELQRYTSFKARTTTDGPVRQILVNDKGVVVLGSRDIHMASRKGPPIWHIRCVATHAAEKDGSD